MPAVDALLTCRRLTLTDMARAWPGTERVRAPLKALDRLLSNPRLHVGRESLYANMARRLLRGTHPVMVVDWSDLKADKSWCLLRAAVPIGGWTLAILDMVFTGKQQGSPGAEKHFLERLKTLVPAGMTPILFTDAGFRNPWFRAAEAMGWYGLGRVRHRTFLTRPGTSVQKDAWLPCRALYALVTSRPQDLGKVEIARYRPLLARMVLYRNVPKGRKHRTRLGEIARSKASRQAAAREREPWLIVASLLWAITPKQMIKRHARRMQIELAFRDLKSHRYGQAFEDSLTHKGARIEILLLLSAMAAFASWVAGMADDAMDMARWLTPHGAKRKLCSVLRLGREALVRQWPIGHVTQWLEALRSPPDHSTAPDELPVMKKRRETSGSDAFSARNRSGYVASFCRGNQPIVRSRLSMPPDSVSGRAVRVAY